MKGIRKAGAAACVATALVAGLFQEGWMSSQVVVERTSAHFRMQAMGTVGQMSPPGAEEQAVEYVRKNFESYLAQVEPAVAAALARKWPAPSKGFPLIAYASDIPLVNSEKIDPYSVEQFMRDRPGSAARYRMQFSTPSVSEVLMVEVCFSTLPRVSVRSKLAQEIERALAAAEPR